MNEIVCVHITQNYVNAEYYDDGSSHKKYVFDTVAGRPRHAARVEKMIGSKNTSLHNIGRVPCWIVKSW